MLPKVNIHRQGLASERASKRKGLASLLVPLSPVQHSALSGSILEVRSRRPVLGSVLGVRSRRPFSASVLGVRSRRPFSASVQQTFGANTQTVKAVLRVALVASALRQSVHHKKLTAAQHQLRRAGSCPLPADCTPRAIRFQHVADGPQNDLLRPKCDTNQRATPNKERDDPLSRQQHRSTARIYQIYNSVHRHLCGDKPAFACGHVKWPSPEGAARL